MKRKLRKLKTLDNRIDLTDKLIALTGGTDGMGLPLAYRIAAANATLLLLARNPEKGEIICKKIIAETQNKKVFSILLDLSQLDSIKSAASIIKSRYQQLDILICNAGTEYFGNDQRQTTPDGFDMTMGVNHFGNSALILHLLPIIRAAPNPRIVVNASEQYRKNKFLNLANIDLTQNYSHKHAYQQSKLANVLFVRALARREPNIQVYALHPGGVYTPMMKRALSSRGLIPHGFLKRVVFLSPDEAAAGIERVAVDPSIGAKSGSFFWTGKEVEIVPVGLDDETGEKLWELTLNRLKMDKK